MNSYIPKRIYEMKEYVPDTSCPKIKLDANESPFESSDQILALIAEQVDFTDINRYPDPTMAELLSAYGKHVGLPSDQIVAGDGSDELIALIINTFLEGNEKILICEPDFSMYRFYAEFSGVQSVVYQKKNGIETDPSELAELCKKEGCKLVILSNPCNPTGCILDKASIMKFVSECGALAVIDEAYMEFAPKSESVIDKIEEYDNLIVLKTVSKIGLAGLRCGFALSNKELISALKKTKSPYNLNSITQKAVSVVLNNYSSIEENLIKIRTETQRLYEIAFKYKDKFDYQLSKSHANFVYLRFNGQGEAKKLHGALKDMGISVRLSANTLRVTTGKSDEVSAFEKALEKITV